MDNSSDPDEGWSIILVIGTFLLISFLMEFFSKGL